MADKTGSVFVLGATRETGLETVQLLHQRGDEVTALVRPDSDRQDLEKVGVNIVFGDAFERADLDAILAEGGFRAVISSLGGQFRDTRRVDFEGNRNAIDAAKSAGVKRYLMVTMIGSGDSLNALSSEAQEIFAKTLELKNRAEEYLMASGLDYTILRPGGMLSEPATGRGMLSEDRNLMGTIHRADLAQLILDCLDDVATIGKIYATVDREMTGMPELKIPRAKKT